MSNRLIAHLAHVEVLTPKPDESVRFYRDILGLEESGREGRSAYLRGWGEWSHHSLQVTEATNPGLGHVGWRMWSPHALEAAVARVEAAGAGEGWFDDAVGHGRAYRYRGPGGQVHELFYDDRRHVPPAGMESPFPDRPQRYVPRGIYPRMIDHVTVMTDDPIRDAEWYRDTLGSTFTEYTVLPHADIPVFAMSTNNEKSHDLGLILDQSGVPGRLHHVAWWVDSREDLLRAADILLNADTAIEFGPGRHGMGEQDYLYFREPGGVRIELNSGGYKNYEPDFETVRFEPQQGSNVFYKNNALPPSMFESFPPVEFAPPQAEEARAATGLFN